LNPAPNLWQRRSKNQNTVIFILIANGPPTLVITILLSAPIIASRSLNMPIGQRADPDVVIGWRNGKPPNSKQTRFVLNQFPFSIEVLKGFTIAFAGVTGPRIADITKPGFFRSVNGVSNNVGTLPTALLHAV
jgi:hypothetical protein